VPVAVLVAQDAFGAGWQGCTGGDLDRLPVGQRRVRRVSGQDAAGDAPRTWSPYGVTVHGGVVEGGHVDGRQHRSGQGPAGGVGRARPAGMRPPMRPAPGPRTAYPPTAALSKAGTSTAASTGRAKVRPAAWASGTVSAGNGSASRWARARASCHGIGVLRRSM